MTHWERTKQLFAHALELSPEERQSFLATACAGEDSLRQELETLLLAHGQAKSFMESPLLGDPLAATLMDSVDGGQDTIESPKIGQTTSASDAFVGRVLSRYRLEQQLGAGGMGVLYRATDLRLGRTVAIKLLARHLIGDVKAKARFVREARAASALDHPNIGTIHDIGEDGELFIVMALYEGKTLKRRLEEGRPTVDEALTIVRQLLLGLEAAHLAGIVHRDIKPANIMITSSGTIKILDFGLAKLVSDSQSQTMTRAGQAIGTILYMSPEALRGGPVDSRSDLWSLGVVAYELLAGVSPFQADSSAATALRVLNEQPPTLSTVFDVPDWLADLVSQLLRKNPDERPRTASDVLQRLESGNSSKRIVPDAGPTPAAASDAQRASWPADLQQKNVANGRGSVVDHAPTVRLPKSPGGHRRRLFLIAAVVALAGAGVVGVRWSCTWDHSGSGAAR